MGLDTDSYTEDQAGDMYCPLAMTKGIPVSGPDVCRGSKCMAWRWSQTKKTNAFSKRTIEVAKEEGLKLHEAIDWVLKNENDQFKRTEGYCGLAGYPHNSVKP